MILLVKTNHKQPIAIARIYTLICVVSVLFALFKCIKKYYTYKKRLELGKSAVQFSGELGTLGVYMMANLKLTAEYTNTRPILFHSQSQGSFLPTWLEGKYQDLIDTYYMIHSKKSDYFRPLITVQYQSLLLSVFTSLFHLIIHLINISKIAHYKKIISAIVIIPLFTNLVMLESVESEDEKIFEEHCESHFLPRAYFIGSSAALILAAFLEPGKKNVYNMGTLLLTSASFLMILAKAIDYHFASKLHHLNTAYSFDPKEETSQLIRFQKHPDDHNEIVIVHECPHNRSSLGRDFLQFYKKYTAKNKDDNCQKFLEKFEKDNADAYFCTISEAAPSLLTTEDPGPVIIKDCDNDKICCLKCCQVFNVAEVAPPRYSG